MSKRSRKLIFLLFLALFLVSAPLIVLYTAGYRYNFGTGKIVQTGVLSLTTTPKNASVFLNGDLLDSVTPVVLKNIFPGEHSIRMEKDGYTAWEKRLTVKSRETTFVDNAILFVNEIPAVVKQTPLTAVSLNPNLTKAVYAITQGPWAEIWVYDFGNGSESLISRLSVQAEDKIQLQWMENGTVLIVTIMTPKTRSSTYIDISTGTPLSSPLSDTIILSHIDGRVVVTRKQDQSNEILAYLPEGTYIKHDAPDNIIMLEEQKEGRVVLLRSSGGDQPILLNAKATSWQWEPNGTRFLYSDSFDLHVFESTSQSDETITRLSYAITGVGWVPGLPVVLYAQEDSLYSIELDYRDIRIVTKLVSGSNLETFTTDQNGEVLYFFGTVGESSGLFSKRLQK